MDYPKFAVSNLKGESISIQMHINFGIDSVKDCEWRKITEYKINNL